MSRVYEVTFSNASVAAVQDLFQAGTTASTASWCVHMVRLGQVSKATVENLRITMKRFSGAWVVGAGGSSATPATANSGDSAAKVAARVNDTTQTSGGSATTVLADGYNVVNGYEMLWAPEDRPWMRAGEGFVVSLDTAPGSTEVTNGVMIIEEI